MRLSELFNNPGVSIGPMTDEEAYQYIMDMGMMLSRFPRIMAAMGHNTLRGHLVYVHEENLKTDGARDTITLLKALTNIEKDRAEQPGLPEAVARMNKAHNIVTATAERYEEPKG
ncbi:hypothetical protein [Nannocystis pusilla]|uniref:Uncharacterized protein n=1 Tax=Nannocystis pusilla TaxID=889268 RepID=A0ABS7TN56_9BACT|nr:hypothetical protein [Nannocystis pusilla]MBZ5709630.1 hypothetical protein [Nannocystis pusilla]